MSISTCPDVPKSLETLGATDARVLLYIDRNGQTPLRELRRALKRPISELVLGAARLEHNGLAAIIEHDGEAVVAPHVTHRQSAGRP